MGWNIAHSPDHRNKNCLFASFASMHFVSCTIIITWSGKGGKVGAMDGQMDELGDYLMTVQLATGNACKRGNEGGNPAAAMLHLHPYMNRVHGMDNTDHHHLITLDAGHPTQYSIHFQIPRN